MRIIDGVNPREHTDDLFVKLKFMKLEKINTYLVGNLMFKIHQGIVTMFDDFFVKNKDVHPYVTRQTDNYHIPLCKKNIGKASFKFHGAVVWNDILKQEINLNVSEYVFAKNLKSVLLQNLL